VSSAYNYDLLPLGSDYECRDVFNNYIAFPLENEKLLKDKESQKKLMIAFPIHYLLHRHSSKATDAY
jgi:hypothetical protein